MSPWASFSATSTVVTAERSPVAPPSSSGTPSIAAPSSAACASSSSGAAAAVSASCAAGRSRAVAKSPKASCSICCSSLGVRSKSLRDVVLAWRAGWVSRWVALKARPAATAVRKPLRLPL